jgi:starch synthase
MGAYWFNYSIIKEKTNLLGFDLYLVDINGLLDREAVYGYGDDTERFTAFQIAVVDWVAKWNHHPDVVHVHDHHAGLVPFMMQHCFAYRHLSAIPTVLTIHNAQYQGGINQLICLPGIHGRGVSWIGKIGLIHWPVQLNV